MVFATKIEVSLSWPVWSAQRGSDLYLFMIESIDSAKIEIITVKILHRSPDRSQSTATSLLAHQIFFCLLVILLLSGQPTYIRSKIDKWNDLQGVFGLMLATHWDTYRFPPKTLIQMETETGIPISDLCMNLEALPLWYQILPQLSIQMITHAWHAATWVGGKYNIRSHLILDVVTVSPLIFSEFGDHWLR